MTVGAKKAPRNAREPLSWWADERVPNLQAVLSPHGVDVADFARWLAPKLGTFRGEMYIRRVMPSAAEINASLTALADTVRDAHAKLRAIPPHDKALMATVALRRGINPDALIERLSGDLLTLQVLAQHARSPSPPPARRGRKPKGSRDALLAEVADHLRGLGLRVKASREAAQQIAVACGIGAATDERTLRRKLPVRGGRNCP